MYVIDHVDLESELSDKIKNLIGDQVLSYVYKFLFLDVEESNQ